MAAGRQWRRHAIKSGIAAQTLPTGIRRIFADQNPYLRINGVDDFRVDVDAAVLDTGIDSTHPDLNVVSRVDCVDKTSCIANAGNDGHGSHVAGTVGAIDNGIGVVGVAPGARLWSVKVLSDSGSGSYSGVIAGIDWVTARADRIEVANMSLGGPPSTAINDAIRRSVDAGVIHAVAAGNDDQDARNKSPANSPDVITVSALADFNGAAGGGGAPTCRTDQDDTLADFSNWGPAVEITAPAVCIYSTYRAGDYSTLGRSRRRHPTPARRQPASPTPATTPR